MSQPWFMITKEKPLKKCRRCKSKKLVNATVGGKNEEDGHVLIQNIPAQVCKKCGTAHVGLRANLASDVLEAWLEDDGPFPHQRIQ